jgi:hypothetical protein
MSCIFGAAGRFLLKLTSKVSLVEKQRSALLLTVPSSHVLRRSLILYTHTYLKQDVDRLIPMIYDIFQSIHNAHAAAMM